MDPKAIILEAGIALARYFWHRAHGADTKPDEAALRAAGLRAAQAATDAAVLELKQRADAAEMQAATIELDRAQAALMYELGRVETDPSPDVPHILEGADVQQMPADWVPPVDQVEPVDDTKGERVNWDDIKTPVPEGSSER